MKSDNSLVSHNTTMAVYSSPVAFFNAYTPEKSIAVFAQVNSIEKAISNKSPTLAGIRKQFDKEIAVEYIKLWLIDINEYLGLRRSMSESQINQTAQLIFAAYYMLSIADIYLLFTRIKRNEYGNLYDSLNGAKIIEFFEKYLNERNQTCFDLSCAEHERIRYAEQKATKYDKTFKVGQPN